MKKYLRPAGLLLTQREFVPAGLSSPPPSSNCDCTVSKAVTTSTSIVFFLHVHSNPPICSSSACVTRLSYLTILTHKPKPIVSPFIFTSASTSPTNSSISIRASHLLRCCACHHCHRSVRSRLPAASFEGAIPIPVSSTFMDNLWSRRTTKYCHPFRAPALANGNPALAN